MKFPLLFSSCAILLALFGCATPEIAKPKPASAILYRVDRELAALPLKFTAAKNALAATTADGKTLQFKPDSNILVFQECKIYLPEKVTLSSDGLYRAGERTLKLLRALVQNPEGHHIGRRILVDAGHGGHDQGAKGKKILEKDVNLALAQSIALSLCERGFIAQLSRSDDRFFTLEERVRMARSYDIFISVHHNGSTSSSSCGLETFAPESPRARQTESVVLAFMVQRNMVRATREVDRGVKTGRLYVLEHTTIPAILIEAGFMTNPSDERKISDDIRRQKIADAVADALVSFYETGTPKTSVAPKRAPKSKNGKAKAGRKR